MRVECRDTYTWNGAPTPSEVSLPEWLHQYVSGWSGEQVYLNTGNDPVEIGESIEWHYNNDNAEDSYIQVITSSAYE